MCHLARHMFLVGRGMHTDDACRHVVGDARLRRQVNQLAQREHAQQTSLIVLHVEIADRLGSVVHAAHLRQRLRRAHLRLQADELLGHQLTGAVGWVAQQAPHAGRLVLVHGRQQRVLLLRHVLDEDFGCVVHRQSAQ